MTKVLTFRVEIDGLEDKIWRIIEITDKKTVAELAYTILATFDSLAYHLYKIKYKDMVYDSWIDIEDDHSDIPKLNATIIKLSELDLVKNDYLEMDYDLGSTTTFKIHFLGYQELKKGTGRHYPYIVSGAGREMMDDLSDFELKEIVNDIDQKGYSKYEFTPGYDRTIKYDYRDFDLKNNNVLLKGEISEIKDRYEEIEYE